jgi:hypothetical protein
LTKRFVRQPSFFDGVDTALDHLLQEKRLFAPRRLGQQTQSLLDLRINAHRDNNQFVFGASSHSKLRWCIRYRDFAALILDVAATRVR